MADPTKDDRPPLDATLTNRRRPGRVDYQDAQLIALLRGQPTNTNPASAEVDAAPKVRRTDDLSPARGILIAAPIGAAIWAAKRRTRYATVHGTKKDAQAELIRQLAAVDNGSAVDPSKVTVAESALFPSIPFDGRAGNA